MGFQGRAIEPSLKPLFGKNAWSFHNSLCRRGQGILDDILALLLMLVRWCGREDGDYDYGCPNGMPPDRDVVDVLEEVHAERVDETLKDKDSGVDANRDARRWHKRSVEGRKGGKEIGYCKAISRMSVGARGSDRKEGTFT